MTGKRAESVRESYLEFAFAYDQALGMRFFASFRPLLHSILDRYPDLERTHLDLACGTGLALEHFQKRGFRSVGLDSSMAMLSIARGRGARLVAADLRAPALRGGFGLVTCLYDSLNHLLDWDDLVLAFRSASALLREGSILLFDVNHPDVYPRTWGLPEPFVSGAADHRLVLDTRYLPEARLGIAEISGWARIGGRRVPISEIHRQRAWGIDEIRSALAAGGLNVLEEVGFDPFLESGEGGAVKIVFVAGLDKKSTSFEVLRKPSVEVPSGRPSSDEEPVEEQQQDRAKHRPDETYHLGRGARECAGDETSDE
jgi:SAM-dependent methyltransferase